MAYNIFTSMMVNTESLSDKKIVLYYLNTYGLLLNTFRKVQNIELIDIKSRLSLVRHIKIKTPTLVAIDYNCKWIKLTKDITHISLTFNVPILLVCNEKVYKEKNTYLKQIFKAGISDIITPKTTFNELEEILSLMLEMTFHCKIPQNNYA